MLDVANSIRHICTSLGLRSASVEQNQHEWSVKRTSLTIDTAKGSTTLSWLVAIHSFIVIIAIKLVIVVFGIDVNDFFRRWTSRSLFLALSLRI